MRLPSALTTLSALAEQRFYLAQIAGYYQRTPKDLAHFCPIRSGSPESHAKDTNLRGEPGTPSNKCSSVNFAQKAY